MCSKKKYSCKFSYYQFFTDKIKKAELNPDYIELSSRINITHKNSGVSEKNNNIGIDNKEIEERVLKIKKDKDKHKIKLNQNDKINQLPKDKNILKSRDNKNINSKNPLNTIQMNKNQEILSESNNCNASNEQLNEGNSNDNKYKQIQTLQNIKNEIEENAKEKKKVKEGKSVENLFTNNVINNKSGNSFHEVNLNYVNNFCSIY